MTSTNRSHMVALTLAAFGVAVAGTAFCIVQIYRTAQLPQGDGTGMQWVILTPLAMLFLFIVVPAYRAGRRGLRLLQIAPEARRPPADGDQRREGAVGQDQVRRATGSETREGGVDGTVSTEEMARVLPGRGWLIALGLLALSLLAPFVVAPVLGLFMPD